MHYFGIQIDFLKKNAIVKYDEMRGVFSYEAVYWKRIA